MLKHKLILPVGILLGCIILGWFFYAVQINKRKAIVKQQEVIDKCYAHEDKKCVTQGEKNIVKLISNNAILREVQPVPSFYDNVFIGIYIENPVLAEKNTDETTTYMDCYSEKRGQSISGIYHLFTYSDGVIKSDIIIPNDEWQFPGENNLPAMAWKNTKMNNFDYFNGKPYSKNDSPNLEISSLINFADYNGDGNKYEFILYGGTYGDCSTDTNLIAGYDEKADSAVIYKVVYKDKSINYWNNGFFPNENGDVFFYRACGDHARCTDIKMNYKYNKSGKFYYLVDRIEKECKSDSDGFCFKQN